MYYSFPCESCSKIFYTFNDDKNQAASVLYVALKQHLDSYGEKDRDDLFTHDTTTDANNIYNIMTATSSAPSGGYQV
jgi:hypothetical protein